VSSSSQAGFFLDPATHENVLAEEEMETQVRSGQSSRTPESAGKTSHASRGGDRCSSVGQHYVQQRSSSEAAASGRIPESEAQQAELAAEEIDAVVWNNTTCSSE